MSITNELREWASTKVPYQYGHQISEIANRIDTEHERLCSRSRSNGYSDGFIDGFNDIKSWVIDHEDEMAEHGWVKLPKDADGEVIHVGDKLDDGWRTLQGEVRELILDHDGWWFRFKDKCELFYVHEFHEWHHYHAPTVEDILREMLDKWGEMPSNMTNEAIVAEYAAKLRLAGGDE